MTWWEWAIVWAIWATWGVSKMIAKFLVFIIALTIVVWALNAMGVLIIS